MTRMSNLSLTIRTMFRRIVLIINMNSLTITIGTNIKGWIRGVRECLNEFIMTENLGTYSLTITIGPKLKHKCFKLFDLMEAYFSIKKYYFHESDQSYAFEYDFNGFLLSTNIELDS